MNFTDKSFNSITCELSQGVLEITLDRPEVLNSLNQELCQELLDVFDCIQSSEPTYFGDSSAVDESKLRSQMESSPAVRAILLTGSGRAFCAGQDIGELTSAKKQDIERIVRDRCNAIVRAIRQTPCPVVCLVNGVAAGAGANLALCCDIVYAAEDAKFVQAFVNIGLIPDTAGTYTLPRLVGLGRASALAMLGEPLSAKDAASMGLIYQSLPPSSALETARHSATQLAKKPAKALCAIKYALSRSLSSTLDEQLDLEERLQKQLGETADFKEGITAFLEKRAPVFQS
jgi:2-(1,2-epoxy-1,2-dihydrophenyl)acetyl-CoA isomerase